MNKYKICIKCILVSTDPNILKTIPEKKYSPASISVLFMQYLDQPQQALSNIGQNETVIL